MHSTRKIKEDLIYVGGSDRRLSRFENLFPIPRGVSYNSYVLLDDKTVLMDTADESISRQYIENVVHALDGRPLDYMIVQHMEPDHCAMIDAVMSRYPGGEDGLHRKGGADVRAVLRPRCFRPHARRQGR